MARPVQKFSNSTRPPSPDRAPLRLVQSSKRKISRTGGREALVQLAVSAAPRSVTGRRTGRSHLVARPLLARPGTRHASHLCNRQQPFGSAWWQTRIDTLLGLESMLRARGRPRSHAEQTCRVSSFCYSSLIESLYPRALLACISVYLSHWLVLLYLPQFSDCTSEHPSQTMKSLTIDLFGAFLKRYSAEEKVPSNAVLTILSAARRVHRASL